MDRQPATPATKTCADCGTGFLSSDNRARYCSPACRHAFTRRRRDRGAELYDFVMAGDTKMVAKLVAAYHQADLMLRGGRPSFIDAGEAALNIPIVYGKNGDKR